MNPFAAPTTVRLLTPGGTGAVAVLRLTGPEAIDVARRLFVPAGAGVSVVRAKPDQLHYGRFVIDGEVIDEGLLCIIPPDDGPGPAPSARPRPGRDARHSPALEGQHSPAADGQHNPAAANEHRPAAKAEHRPGPPAEHGLDMGGGPGLAHTVAGSSGVEMTCHGGTRIVERLLDACCRLGADIAPSAQSPADAWTPADRIDRDIFHALGQARTWRAVRFLARQRAVLGPALREALSVMRTGAAGGDALLRGLLARSTPASRLVYGARVVIAGPPNAGKSTLFNRLAGRHAAIASSEPGTTRDWVTVEIELGGVGITLHDTAGVRDQPGAIEAQAIRSGRALIERADLVMGLVDASDPAVRDQLRAWFDPGAASPTLIVFNKQDRLDTTCTRTPAIAAPLPDGVATLPISARTGWNVSVLEDAIIRGLGLAGFSDDAPCLFTRRACRLVRRFLRSGAGQSVPVARLARALFGPTG